MKGLLTTLLIFAALALCGLCVVQWRREALLRDEISRVSSLYQTESKQRVEAEEKVASYEQEITRLTRLRADTEARLLEVTGELSITQTDQLQRGVSIALMGGEWIKDRARAETAEKRAKEATALLARHQEGVSSQNSIITAANDRLKQLAAERDKAINELNARTKAYNDLVVKYNKLVK